MYKGVWLEYLKIEKTYIIPDGSGFLSMLSISDNRFFVSHEDGYVHVIILF